jgi:putative FmdB family regulatory protein
MPIYEYSCQKCGAHMEVMQKISDKPLARHQKCGGKLVKEWSQTSFQLKGSGWYVTDYAGKKQDKAESKETKETTKSEPAESKSATASETKAGTKAETKTETKAAKPKSAPAPSGD